MGMVGVPMTTETLTPRLHSELFREHLGSGIWTRHGVDRQQNVLRTASTDGEERKRMDSVEQCRNRAMPRSRAAAMTTSVPRQLTAWKIAFVSHPHAGKTGKMINLLRRSGLPLPGPD